MRALAGPMYLEKRWVNKTTSATTSCCSPAAEPCVAPHGGAPVGEEVRHRGPSGTTIYDAGDSLQHP
jgi:hypothetical protein